MSCRRARLRLHLHTTTHHELEERVHGRCDLSIAPDHDGQPGFARTNVAAAHRRVKCRLALRRGGSSNFDSKRGF